uniref:PPUP9740 n=1 Tax=Poeciliopsis prolifica TaxID=188132 RepID=A0A0S7EGI9_9TELE
MQLRNPGPNQEEQPVALIVVDGLNVWHQTLTSSSAPVVLCGFGPTSVCMYSINVLRKWTCGRPRSCIIFRLDHSEMLHVVDITPQTCCLCFHGSHTHSHSQKGIFQL